MKVFLVTTIFGKTVDDLRIQLALKTLAEAGKYGYNIIVVDGSPEDSGIPEALKAVGEHVYYEREAPFDKNVSGGMGASRRQCISSAFSRGADVVVWLEPEKHTIVRYLERCITPVLKGNTDIVVPYRESMDSYPQYQRESELRANWGINAMILKCLGINILLDLMSGPRIIGRDAGKLFTAFVPETAAKDNWEILFLPVIRALFGGMKVSSVVIPYKHPEEQSQAEVGPEWDAKRDKQRDDLIAGTRDECIRLKSKVTESVAA